MKIAEIPVGVDLYFSDSQNWREPARPARPVQRVDTERYSRSYHTLRVSEDPKGRLIKIKHHEGRTEYVPSGQIKGLYADVHPEIKAGCDERAAVDQARRDEHQATKDELRSLLAQLADAIGMERPVDGSPLAWQVSEDRWSQYVRTGVEGLRAVLGHIRRQDELIEKLEDEGSEARLDAKAAYAQVEQARAEAYHNRAS